MAKYEQKIALGIDFTEFDRQLRSVSSRIENAAADVRMPAMGGSGAGPSVGSAGADSGQIGAAIAGLGSNLAAGFAGAGAATAAAVGRMEAALDRLAGASITIFRRIDAAIKFPAFELAMKRAQAALDAMAASAQTRFGRVGATLASAGLRGYAGFSRLTEYLRNMGDVGGKSLSQIDRGFAKAAGGASMFGRTMKLAEAPVGALTTSVKGLGVQIAAAFGLVGVVYKTVQFFKDGVMAASDLNEAVSRSKVVFGDSFGSIEAQASKMSRAFGISRKAQVDIASGFGAMAQGAGFSEEASASLANQLTKMAADLSSSVNIPFEEAGEKIRAALAGEAEPLRQYGANILDSTVKSYALASGIAKSAKAMTEQEKMTARAALIMRGLSYAQNDLENTSGAAANQFRKAGGGLAEFGTRIGELLLPAVQTGTMAFNELLASALELVETSMPTLQSWAEGIKGAVDSVAFVVRNLGAIWQIAQLRTSEFVTNAILWVGTLPENFRRVTEWLGRNWRELLIDLLNFTRVTFTNLVTNAVALGEAIWTAIQGGGFDFTWTPLLDGFISTAEQLPELLRPELVSMQGEIDKVLEGVGRREMERAAAMAKAGGGAPVPKPGAMGEAAAKESEYKLSSAVEIGSKEAYSIIAKSLSPGANRDPGRQVVEVGKQGNAILRDIRDAVKGGVKPALQVR